MKIVVRAPNWIGDSILAIPAIESLSKNTPDIKIWIAAQSWVKDLFTSFDFIEGIIPIQCQTNLKDLNNSARKLKDFHFDAGLLLTNSFSSALLFYRAKIPERWGYIRDSRQILLTKGVPLKNKEEYSHQVKFYLDLISALGFKTIPPKLSLPLTQKEKRDSKKMLLSLGVDLKKNIITFNPGAFYGPAKRWPPSNYAKLAGMFQQRNDTEILIIGSINETFLGESIASEMSKKPTLLAGKTNLRLLAGIISHSNLLVTNDSGPMHMANALNIPIVSLFGPTDPRVTGPFQEPASVIKKDVACWPCSYRECPFDHRCMMQIEPEEVYKVCLTYLK